MAFTRTTFLSLFKPTPGTNENWNTVEENADKDKIDTFAAGVDFTWQDFIPNWTSGMILGSEATNLGRYIKVGKLLIWQVRVIIGMGGNVDAYINLASPFPCKTHFLGQATLEGGSTRNGGITQGADNLLIYRIVREGLGWDALEPLDWQPGYVFAAQGMVELT